MMDADDLNKERYEDPTFFIKTCVDCRTGVYALTGDRCVRHESQYRTWLESLPEAAYDFGVR
jgi:hypothetical protein